MVDSSRISPNERKPRLQDVAAAAGVSASVVSRVLSGKGDAFRISSQTSSRVKKIAEQLGFRPDSAARALRSGKSVILGVVVPDIANPFFAAITQQVNYTAEQYGYSVILVDSCNSLEREIEQIERLRSRQPEGLIVCPIGEVFGHLHRVAAEGCPIVLVDRVPKSNVLPSITSDHRWGGKILASHLLDNGHRTIGIVQGLQGTLPNELRIAGVMDAIRDFGKKSVAVAIGGSGFTIEDGCRACLDLLRENPAITALIALGNPQAIGCLKASRELGRRIPCDLSLVSFDDHPLAGFLESPLTVVAQDVSELGRRASTMLYERIKHAGLKVAKVSPVENMIVPVSLEQRSSVSRISVARNSEV